SPHISVRDGAMTTALMLECLASRGMSFSRSLAHSVPRFFQSKTKVEVPPKRVDSIMKTVERLSKGRVEKTDGLKVWTDERSWVLVRPSGTEPIIRIFTESETQAGADALSAKYVKLVRASSR
ncbi:MAG TPA: phosphoglucosamine mutase, partial [Nitrososphaerales archaeon]|nr:phosphoglucosamine mutase [Nitrososphaerales archaeon]